jgi:hypothetical protein
MFNLGNKKKSFGEFFFASEEHNEDISFILNISSTQSILLFS